MISRAENLASAKASPNDSLSYKQNPDPLKDPPKATARTPDSSGSSSMPGNLGPAGGQGRTDSPRDLATTDRPAYRVDPGLNLLPATFPAAAPGDPSSASAPAAAAGPGGSPTPKGNGPEAQAKASATDNYKSDKNSLGSIISGSRAQGNGDPGQVRSLGPIVDESTAALAKATAAVSAAADGGPAHSISGVEAAGHRAGEQAPATAMAETGSNRTQLRAVADRLELAGTGAKATAAEKSEPAEPAKAAMRAPAGGTSLSLRKKLRLRLTKGGPAEKEKSEMQAGGGAEKAEDAKQVAAGGEAAAEEVVAASEGPTPFQMNGSETDAEVRRLTNEAKQGSDSEILGIESPPLFDRVHGVHQRSLKNGKLERAPKQVAGNL